MSALKQILRDWQRRAAANAINGGSGAVRREMNFRAAIAIHSRISVSAEGGGVDFLAGCDRLVVRGGANWDGGS